MRQIKNSGLVKRVILLSLLFVFVLKVNSQENRKLENFDAISFNISGDLYITQSNEYAVRLEGNKKDIDKITTRVDGNKLVIKTDNFSWLSNKVTVHVSLPELSALKLAGSGKVFANKTFKSNDLKIALSGSGNIHFKDLLTETASLKISGSGNININGKAQQELKIGISGSGNVNAAAFEAKDVAVSISGSGSSRVFATENLETRISGSGNVRYKGRPLVNASSSGSGSTKSL